MTHYTTSKASTFAFYPTQNQTKKCKRACLPTHQEKQTNNRRKMAYNMNCFAKWRVK